MGLKGVKEVLQKSRWFYRMWRRGHPLEILLQSDDDEKKTNKSQVLYFAVADMMTDVFSFGTGVKTPREFYNRFRQFALYCLRRTPSMQGVILRMDIEPWKPPEKAKVQKERDQRTLSRKKGGGGEEKKVMPPMQPYPSDCVIHDHAILHPPTSQTFPLDISRLMISRDFRPRLWEYIERMILEDPIWPLHTNLIFEWRMTGPRLLRYDFDKLKRFQWYEMLPDCHNGLGEADPAVIWWILKILESYPNDECRFILKTRDSDTLPLAVKHFWNLPTKQREIYWIHEKDGYVNLNELLTILQTPIAITSSTKVMVRSNSEPNANLAPHIRWTPELFTAACIISGCDYYDKDKTTHRIGHDTIWEALHIIGTWITKPFDTPEGFSEFIRSIWGRHYQCSDRTTAAPSFQWLKERACDKKTKKTTTIIHCPLSDDVLRPAFEEFKFVFNYWMTLDRSRAIQNLLSVKKKN
jgi:hypothetical protein